MAIDNLEKEQKEFVILRRYRDLPEAVVKSILDFSGRSRGEFTHRSWHKDASCVWDGSKLILQADNDYDRTDSLSLMNFRTLFQRI